MGASLVYLKEPNKEIEQEKGNNHYLSYATGSMQGWRLNMEDSHLSLTKFLNSDQKALFGVFDGHGGRECAVYCTENYPQILENNQAIMESQGVEEWLRQSFLKVDEQLRTLEGQNRLGDLRRQDPPKKPPLLAILSKENKKDPSEQTNEELNLDAIGCTSNVVFIDKEQRKIYVANAGDSRCCMGSNGRSIEMSKDHKPDCEIEIERITKAGSTITEGRVDGNLNLTRSLGDLKHKDKMHLTPEEQAITANPDTYVFDLTDDIDFIIMGCDGIWEKRSNEEMVKYIYDKVAQIKNESTTGDEQNVGNQQIDLKRVVRELLLETVADDVAGAEGVGCDNMTCVLIWFHKH